MNSTKMRIFSIFMLFAVLGLTGCGSIESAAQDDCTSIGWQIGSKGYQDCYKARLYERKLDYSLPPGDKPSPSLI
jgi:ABC-type glycerol-3-phosphate transport system substrate-binding protein